MILNSVLIPLPNKGHAAQKLVKDRLNFSKIIRIDKIADIINRILNERMKNLLNTLVCLKYLVCINSKIIKNKMPNIAIIIVLYHKRTV